VNNELVSYFPEADMAKTGVLTTGEAAERLGVPTWALRRLYERGLLPEPGRMGLYRAVPIADLPMLREKLLEYGYLRPEVAAAV
jgi:hypothetical protein